jgi:hypothetical protein
VRRNNKDDALESHDNGIYALNDVKDRQMASERKTIYTKDGTKYTITRSRGRLVVCLGSFDWGKEKGRVDTLTDALALIKADSGQEIKSIE